ncbi:hypothetical protein FRC03_011109 [Tulasnella sp. 419]|nr:hypothetical protein FRC02_011177 [Tulasnella sp. 418]KAG8955531.1 hypothetical protein FRC03_011109 [Tulasnella sp. 419]
MPLSIVQDALKTAVLQQHTPYMSGAHLFSSNDPNHPLTCGIAVMEKGQTITWTYPGAEFTLMLEGEMEVEDKTNQDNVIHWHLKEGDIVRAEKGDVLTMKTPTRSKAFFVAQIPDGTDLNSIMQIHE